MKRILLCVLLAATMYAAQGQNCTQTLRTARQTYDQGRLHEIETLLDACLKSNGFTTPQKVEAYRILILTYIYLEEPEKADESMIQLLRTDNFFKPNPASDPVEFQSLYKKFRTEPLFKVGFKFGVNTSQINVMKNHYIWEASAGKGEYKSKISIQAGLLFEKNIWRKKFDDKLILNPELFYTTSTFDYSNPGISFQDTLENAVDQMLVTITHRRLQLNAMVQYRLKDSKLAPYVAIGPGFGYLMSSSFGGEVSVGSQITIPEQKTKENYNALSLSVIASAGIKYQIGSVFVTADVRYQYGIGNVVNEEQRFKPTKTNQILHNIGYVDNDFSLNQTMFNVGLIIPYFQPKKLIK